eukprot:129742-Karenia_brevis.AAC.1
MEWYTRHSLLTWDRVNPLGERSRWGHSCPGSEWSIRMGNILWDLCHSDSVEWSAVPGDPAAGP